MKAALVTGAAAAGTIAVNRTAGFVVERALDEGERGSVLGLQLQRRTNDRGISGTERGGDANAALLVASGAMAAGIAGAGAWFGRGGGVAGTVLQVGAGVLAGGMAANLVERLTRDGVTDYLPSPLGHLNVADVALTGGIGMAGLGAALVALR